MALPRRHFLGLAGASGLLAATGTPLSGVLPALPTAPDTDAAGAALPSAADWDLTWVERITGKHRAVFDSPEVSDGAGVFRAVMWMNQYREVYGTERKDMSPVVILRHNGTVLAMNDAYWTTYDVAKEVAAARRGGDAEPAPAPVAGGAPAAVPPVANGAAADAAAAAPATPATPSPKKNPLSGSAAWGLEKFQADGGIVLVCNIAFGQAVSRIRRAQNLTPEAAREAALAQLIPGVILQPSGIFAALRAQEAGCHYIVAS